MIDDISKQFQNAARVRGSSGEKVKFTNKRIIESVESDVPSLQAKNRKSLADIPRQSPPIHFPAPHNPQPSTSSVERAKAPKFTKQDILDVINFLASDDRSESSNGSFLQRWHAFSQNVRPYFNLSLH